MTAGPRFTGAEFAALVTALEDAGGRATIEALSEAVGAKEGRTALAVTWLEEAGEVVVEPDGMVQVIEDGPSGGAPGDRAASAFAARRTTEATRLSMVEGYAETEGCRRVRLLGYFGQVSPARCGNCDRCDREAQMAEAAEPAGSAAVGAVVGLSPFPSGSVVLHAEWGRGEVLTVEEELVTVLFETAGYRTLSLELVEQRDLLRVVGDEGA
jgi:ATP-dependent DNA helicase RecQ